MLAHDNMDMQASASELQKVQSAMGDKFEEVKARRAAQRAAEAAKDQPAQQQAGDSADLDASNGDDAYSFDDQDDEVSWFLWFVLCRTVGRLVGEHADCPLSVFFSLTRISFCFSLSLSEQTSDVFSADMEETEDTDFLGL